MQVLLFINEASVLNTSPILMFLMCPYWDIMYEALGCLRHASKLRQELRTTTSISLDDSWCKESILTGNKKKSENMKTAPGRSFTIRNPGKKCFLQNLAQCLSWWSTFYWIYHCLEVYKCCIFSYHCSREMLQKGFMLVLDRRKEKWGAVKSCLQKVQVLLK